MPGGDDFGARPIDMHVAGLEAMGAQFKFSHGEVEATADRLHGADVTFGFPSVGATENIVTAAVFADGVTTIENAAREPEVVDLCEMLVDDGRRHLRRRHVDASWCAASSGARCAPVGHRTVPDRIQAATYLAAVAVAGGELTIRDARPEHMQNLLARFADMGLELDGRRRRAARGRRGPAAVDRRADAAVPGHRHRLQAARDHDAVRRRRRRHRHREPLPRPVPLRRGADPPRRRRAHQRPPRRRARRAPPVGRARCGPTTSGPARRWSSPAWPPRARP